MRVYCRGVAYIFDIESGETYEIYADELEWEVVDSEERQMGPELHYEAEVDHQVLGRLTWGLWEYPIGVLNYQNTDAGRYEVIADFDYGLEHEPEIDDWLNFDAPSNPYTTFMDSQLATVGILAEHVDRPWSKNLNRMVFSHQITAMEAYLGDTLINEVMKDSAAIQRLIEQDTDLRLSKFTLSQIVSDPDLVKNTVRKHLRETLYHNLPKVDALYRISLNVEVLKLAKDKDLLFQFITVRHDCVHRNGFDKDGNEQHGITKEFVESASDEIYSFVDAVEKAVRTRVR